MDIAGIEYFIDDDPGIGKGTPVGITLPVSNLIADFVVDLDGLKDGDHVVYIRTKDIFNQWGPAYAHGFSITTKFFNKKEVTSWFRMYPNPKLCNYSINFSDTQQGRLILIINDLNEWIVYLNMICDKNKVVSVNLPAGIYRLTIKTGDYSFKQKLVIH